MSRIAEGTESSMVRVGDETSSKPRMHYRGLRGWLDEVAEAWANCCSVNGAHWDTEMGTITQMLTENSRGTAPAILFDEVPGYPKGFRTLYGHLLVDQARRAHARPAARVRAQGRHRAALSRAHAEHEAAAAALRQGRAGPAERARGRQVDVLKFPVPRHHEQDKARYIGTACCVMTQDPDAGWFNLGAYRSQVYDRNTVGCQITEGKHGRIHRDKYFERGQPMKVVILCGQDPLLFMLAVEPAAGDQRARYRRRLARRADRRDPRALYRLPDPGRLRDRARRRDRARPGPAGRTVRRMDGLLLRRHPAAPLSSTSRPSSTATIRS